MISSSSSVICQTTGPKPLPKRFLHIVRSRTSSFNSQYPLLSLRLSSSFLRLLPRLLVTSICHFIFPSITCCRRQFLRKMGPIQLAFALRIIFEIRRNKTPGVSEEINIHAVNWNILKHFRLLLQYRNWFQSRTADCELLRRCRNWFLLHKILF